MPADDDGARDQADAPRATTDDLRSAILACAGLLEVNLATADPTPWPRRWLRRLPLRLPAPLAGRSRAGEIRRTEEAVAATLGLSPTDDLAELMAKVAAIGLDVTSIETTDHRYRVAVVDRRLGTPDTPVVAVGRTPMEAVCRATAQLVVRATAGAGPES